MRLPDGVLALPIAAHLDACVRAIADHGEAIVVAPPGAGKTTAVPLALLGAGRHSGRIVMLEPRRLAARAAARRLAALLGESPGQTVGYQTRDERHIGPSTRIEVVTEGILTRRLQNDPALEGVDVVIFDEVHERNLPTDLGLALALDARRTIRPDLAVVLMSATPDIDAFRRALPEAPVVASDGRLHPVEMHWVPRARDGRGGRPTTDIVPDVVAAVQRALREQAGDLLVFLPGIGEIRRAESLLGGRLPDDVDVFPLAGALSIDDHDAALRPSAAGRRRVVLSTDIAESSLTVAGVRVVVDAGLARVPRFDARTGMSRLTTVATSRASADQRAGRAGRTEPGACYRLWSKVEHATRLAHLPAEILDSDLAGLLLDVALWGTPVDQLGWIDPPPTKACQTSTRLLQALGALTADGAITPRGRRMAAMPVHPRLARLLDPDDLMPADHSTAVALAALVDERDILRGRPDDLPADVGLRLDLLAGRTSHDAADSRAIRQVRDRAVDIARRLGVAFRQHEIDAHRAGLLLGRAFPDRLAAARDTTAPRRGPAQFHLRGGQGAFVAIDDPLADASFVIAADLDGNRSGARIRLGAAIDGFAVAQLFADDIEMRDTLAIDRQRGDLLHSSEIRLGAMLLHRSTTTPTPGADTVAALVQHVRDTRLAVFDWDPAHQLRARLRRAGELQPDSDWPGVDDAQLLDTTGTWLEPYIQHLTSIRELAALDTALLISAQLSWDQQRTLDALLPSMLPTPAGRDAPIDYTRATPTVSVRVQDMFGTRVHPCVADGAVPLTVELLSPADRPIQVTADLPGFWAGSWTAVRKELAGRYPKHQWPTDPAAAPPTRLKPRPDR